MVFKNTPEDPIRCDEAVFSETRVDVDEGVSLRVLQWTPRRPVDDVPVVFVAGWVSVVEGWADALRVIAARRPVYYIESREKTSALIARRGLRPRDFSIARMAEDLVAAVAALHIDAERAVVMASSLGATAVLEALKGGRLAARAAFLVGPNAEFRAPRPLYPITYLPAGLYAVIKYFVLWYVKNFRVDVEREPEQWQRYDRTLRTANASRLKLSARAVFGYKVWPGLDAVRAPVAVAYARSDKLHGSDNVLRIVNTLPNARALPFESNKAMHDERIAAELDAFMAGLHDMEQRSAV